jgi:hypothetical protein
MIRIFRQFRSRQAVTLAALLSLAFLGACHSDGGVSANPIAGSYTATRFDVTPTGQPNIDVKGLGGTFAITIAENNTTSGLVFLPAAATGDGDYRFDMAGTAVVTGGTVKFSQPTTDSFVRDLVWTVNGRTLVVSNQQLNGAQFNIVLTR